MKVDLFIVTYRKDFPYFAHCLRSIGKFCRCFHYLRILVPFEDVGEAEKLVEEFGKEILFPVRVAGYEEKPGKGMVWHMRQILYADTWTDGDWIAHLDPDCIFTDPVTPDDMFIDGKAILRFEPFATIGHRHEAVLLWQNCTQACLPFKVEHETMRAHPEVYHRSTYALARKLVEEKTGHSFDAYILQQENTFPQSFCEHVTLGNVAMVKQPEFYEPVQQRTDRPTPDNKLQQYWSHSPPDVAQHIWVKGVQRNIIPIDMINAILGEKNTVK